jgi:hypothetical protein
VKIELGLHPSNQGFRGRPPALSILSRPAIRHRHKGA